MSASKLVCKRVIFSPTLDDSSACLHFWSHVWLVCAQHTLNLMLNLHEQGFFNFQVPLVRWKIAGFTAQSIPCISQEHMTTSYVQEEETYPRCWLMSEKKPLILYKWASFKLPENTKQRTLQQQKKRELLILGISLSQNLSFRQLFVRKLRSFTSLCNKIAACT